MVSGWGDNQFHWRLVLAGEGVSHAGAVQHGFYEWKRDGKTKQPYCFEVNEGELFAFAGLWDRWKDPSGNWIKACSILTTTPNAVTSPVHDRMPVILDPDAYDLWLDPGINDVSAASEMLKPYDARLMRSYPMSTDQQRGE